VHGVSQDVLANLAGLRGNSFSLITVLGTVPLANQVDVPGRGLVQTLGIPFLAEIVTARQHLIEHSVHVPGVAVPDESTGSVHQECVWDTLHAESFHIRAGGLAFVVSGHRVPHLVAHVRHERLNRGYGLVGDAHDGHTPIAVLVLQVRQMGNILRQGPHQVARIRSGKRFCLSRSTG